MAKNMIRRPFPRGGIRTRLPVTIYRRASDDFSPTEIEGLALWLDASDSSTLFQNSDGTVPATATSDPVGYWGDKSGNGRHAVQATAGSRPVVGTLNGRKALTFDGSNDNLFVEDYSVDNSLPGMTRFIAFDSDATASMIFATTSTSAKTANAGGGIWWQRFGSNWYGYSADAVRYHGGTADESPHIATNFFDGTLAASFGTRLQNYIDGVLLPVVGSQGTLGTTTGASGAKLSIGSNLGINNFVNGKILEVLSYTRALTTTERQRVERYLAARWGITLAPQVSNADAQDWINRVYQNGGSVSSATAGAVDTFCGAIQNAGIRSKMLRLNLFCGTGLNAALVPLYRSASFGGSPLGNATDNSLGSPSFLITDYNETGASGGLLGNGSSKYLNTGLSTNDIGITGHVSAYHRGAMSSGAAIRAGDATTTVGLDYSSGLGVARGFWSPGGTACFATNVGGHYLVTRRSATDMDTYVGGALTRGDSSVTTNITATQNAFPFFVFALNNVGSPVAHLNTRLQGYSIGLSMTQAEATTFSTVMTALQTSLERA